MPDKTSEDYKHLTNDVCEIRQRHWMSVYHQLAIPANLEDVQSILEFGPGRGLSGAVLRHYGLDYKCSDVADFGAKPDFMHSIKEFPEDQKFDLVCAFQTLEHNPPEDFKVHLEKMRDISNKYVYISLPYYGRWFSFDISINVPKLNKNFIWTLGFERLFKKQRPIEKYRQSDTPYAHHWFEVGDEGFSKSDIRKLGEGVGLKQTKAFHSHSFPYHYFILFEKV